MTSLDDRYLEFRNGTDRVFAVHPEAEPLRHYVFKELLIRRMGRSRLSGVASWMRSRLRRFGGGGSLQKADVVVWLESSRREFVDALLPVDPELVAAGTGGQLVAWSSREDLPSTTYRVMPRQRWRTPPWAANAWRDLGAVEPSLAEPALRRAYESVARQLEGLYQEISTVMDAVSPRVVVNANSILIGGAALAVAARQRGAVSVTLQHGIPQAFYTPVVDDLMLTWGEVSTTILGNLGVPRHKLIEVGSPRHDALSRPCAADAKRALVEALDIPQQPTVVFFSNGNDLDRNGPGPVRCAEWLESAAEHHRGVNVVVRLHPNEDGSLYQGCSHLTVTKGVPGLDVTLAGAEVIGTLCSTVLYEALLFGRAVWQFHADGWPELADNWRKGLALRVDSEEGLTALIARVALGEVPGLPSSRTVNRVFANRGLAARKAAAEIAECARHRFGSVSPGRYGHFDGAGGSRGAA